MTMLPAGRGSAFVRLSWAAHGLGAAVLLAAPEAWPTVLGLVAVDHAIIGAACIWPRSRLLGPNLARLRAPATGRVALTFDDGPDPEITPRVLEILDRHRAVASFFCVGQRVDKHPGLTAEIVARGHAVENHTYSHANGFALRGKRSMQADVLRAQDSIERATGRRPRFFRAPAGMKNPWLGRCLAEAGLSLVSWSRRGFDTVSGNADLVTSRLLRGIGSGDILLMHDGGAARDGRGRSVVLEALPKLLDELTARGLRSIALPDDLAGG
jgi:peptidoglycan-N-acetylglucosamine deacetylase